MVIAGLGTAVPSQCYTQVECWEALLKAPRFETLTLRSQAILRKVLTGRSGIQTRHLALDNLADAFELTPDTLQKRYLGHAPGLASQAAHVALKNAKIPPDEIDAVVISTCTGYLCPGLTSYVIENLGLRPEVLALDLVGQGCGAALPNLRTAEALLSSGRCNKVLSVCVEICSAAFYLDDDPGVLVSACLFGDGAGAAVLAQNAEYGRRVEWKGSVSLHHPQSRDLLRFEQKRGMLRNRLSPEVPRLAAEHSEHVLRDGLNKLGVSRSNLTGWLFHPGGRDVLTALQDKLGLTETDIRWSKKVLQEYGNLSSSSVFFVLQTALSETPVPGYWWMGSFGAGFTAHGALWKIE